MKNEITELQYAKKWVMDQIMRFTWLAMDFGHHETEFTDERCLFLFRKYFMRLFIEGMTFDQSSRLIHGDMEKNYKIAWEIYSKEVLNKETLEKMKHTRQAERETGWYWVKWIIQKPEIAYWDGSNFRFKDNSKSNNMGSISVLSEKLELQSQPSEPTTQDQNLKEVIIALKQEGKNLNAVKAVKDRKNLTLQECKDYVDKVWLDHISNPTKESDLLGKLERHNLEMRDFITELINDCQNKKTFYSHELAQLAFKAKSKLREI